MQVFVFVCFYKIRLGKSAELHALCVFLFANVAYYVVAYDFSFYVIVCCHGESIGLA